LNRVEDYQNQIRVLQAALEKADRSALRSNLRSRIAYLEQQVKNVTRTRLVDRPISVVRKKSVAELKQLAKQCWAQHRRAKSMGNQRQASAFYKQAKAVYAQLDVIEQQKQRAAYQRRIKTGGLS